MLTKMTKWLFFDVGTTLVDETEAYNHRIRSPAKKLGMKTIWIRQGFAIYQNPENPEYQPDYIVDNLSELKEIF